MTDTTDMQVAIPLYPGMTALDAIGPYEILKAVPGFDVVFVGAERGSVRTESGMLGLDVDAAFTEVGAPDVVVVPGGPGSRALVRGGPPAGWLRAVHPGTRYTTSVCTGSLILAGAGLLDGLPATTHWSALDTLAELGAVPVSARVVENLPERIVTAAGVSAGIDMAIRLVALLVDDLAAQAAQLLMEYDPEPPFNAGHPSTAGDRVLARLEEYRAALPVLTGAHWSERTD